MTHTHTYWVTSAECCQKRTLGGSMHWKKLLFWITHRQPHLRSLLKQNKTSPLMILFVWTNKSVCTYLFKCCVQCMYQNSMPVFWLGQCCLAWVAVKFHAVCKHVYSHYLTKSAGLFIAQTAVIFHFWEPGVAFWWQSGSVVWGVDLFLFFMALTFFFFFT